jgi:hypothetical protein
VAHGDLLPLERRYRGEFYAADPGGVNATTENTETLATENTEHTDSRAAEHTVHHAMEDWAHEAQERTTLASQPCRNTAVFDW